MVGDHFFQRLVRLRVRAKAGMRKTGAGWPKGGRARKEDRARRGQLSGRRLDGPAGAKGAGPPSRRRRRSGTPAAPRRAGRLASVRPDPAACGGAHSSAAEATPRGEPHARRDRQGEKAMGPHWTGAKAARKAAAPPRRLRRRPRGTSAPGIPRQSGRRRSRRRVRGQSRRTDSPRRRRQQRQRQSSGSLWFSPCRRPVDPGGGSSGTTILGSACVTMGKAVADWPPVHRGSQSSVRGSPARQGVFTDSQRCGGPFGRASRPTGLSGCRSG